MADTIFNMPVKVSLPEGAVPLEAVAMIKYLDKETENTHWLLTSTPKINPVERYGMLMSAVTLTEGDIKLAFVDEPDDEGTEEQ